MTFFLIRTRTDIGYFYLGEEHWWTRRKDQAKRFATHDEACKAKAEATTVEEEREEEHANA